MNQNQNLNKNLNLTQKENSQNLNQIPNQFRSQQVPYPNYGKNKNKKKIRK